MTTGSPAAAGALVFSAKADVNLLGRILYGNYSCVRGLATVGPVLGQGSLAGEFDGFLFPNG